MSDHRPAGVRDRPDFQLFSLFNRVLSGPRGTGRAKPPVQTLGDAQAVQQKGLKRTGAYC